MFGFAIRSEYHRSLNPNPYSYPVEGKLDFEKCQALFKTARDKEAGKPIANNTRLFYDSEKNVFRIRLHQTDILIIDEWDHYTYDNGEWYTMTTKDRLNTYGPLSIFQEKGVWYIGDWRTPKKERTIYFNGMVASKSGNISSNLNEDDLEKKSKKFTKMVSKYIKGFVKDIKENGLSEPNTGDCFGCALGVIKPGKVKENEPMGFDHYVSHFEEGYYTPSLLYKAIIEKGYPDPYIIWEHCCKTNPELHVPMILRWFFNRRRHHIMKCM